ncbi:MAG TPA: HmuY family protein [Bacteroidota bacterium]|nr:HmuY family protein [Bacteroidota bacterium]
MNKIIIYLFLGFVPTFLYAQGKVTVLDESTKKPLHSATVYFTSLEGQTKNNTKDYIIKSVNGYLYKLHFTAFYNEKGVKGYPKFEFQKL